MDHISIVNIIYDITADIIGLYRIGYCKFYHNWKINSVDRIRYIQGVPQHRSHFQISITFSIFSVLTKFKRWIINKGWEFFVILIKKKCCKKAVSSPCSFALVKISLTIRHDMGHIFRSHNFFNFQHFNIK